MFRPTAEKYRPEKTPYLDNFHAVIVISLELVMTPQSVLESEREIKAQPALNII